MSCSTKLFHMEDIAYPEGFVPSSQIKDSVIEKKQITQVARTRTAALRRKCWSTAISPLQQLLYIFFVSWLVGSDPSLFGIIMLATVIYMQIQSLVNIRKSFLPFEEDSDTLTLNTCKFVFLLCNMIGNFVLFYRLKAFGLFDFFVVQSPFVISSTDHANHEEVIHFVWW
ncbi:hypothetical protein GpartN1_g2958.t1 [Galdieria partita]|uniref:ER membrane protein complex subunit 4 n=1 Tax=Galdieria partita TaxID=83374 RepID=A0A9C7UQ41_9RHOD|nr:hypothetical protein GpartN1_g2958.t1 [Galdieria partita]